MKKIYSLILVAASLAVAACQPKELDNIVPDDNPDVKSVKITASIEDISGTKVSYGISDAAIKPAWEEGDELFGFDADGGKFTYVVTEVDATTGEATIEPKQGTYTPKKGTVVYGIYYPGKDTTDIKDGSLAIDLAGQDGTLDGTSPAIMCATATVTEGTEGNEIRFKFLNKTAIIGLKKIQVGTGETLQTGTTVNQIAIEGVVTHGSLSVVNDSLTLTPGTKASTVYAVPNPTPDSWETDDNGQITFGATSPVAFAVLPSTHVPTVYAYTATAAFKNGTPMSTKEMEAGNYYYMSKKLDASAEPVASLTVGDVTSKYYSVSDAFDAADCSNEDCTVKLLTDCSTTRNPQIRGTNGSGDITIDLNGNTLTMSHQFGVYDSNITICDNSSAVLAEQGIITSAVTSAAYYFSGSTLTLAGGTLENTIESQYALYLYGSSNATISGGCVKSDKYRAIYQGNNCGLTITGGKVEAHGNAIYCNAGRTGATNLDVKGNAIVNSDSTALYVSAGVVSVSGSAQISSADRYSLYIGSGSASISGNCSFENPGYVIYSTKYSGIDAPVVNISGGYFNNVKEGWTSTNAPIYAYNGTINISAGHFTATGVNPLTASASGNVNVTGGYYNKAINSTRLGDTYCNIASSEPGYDFQVAQTTAIASVEASSYTFKHSSLEGVARQLSERKDNATVSPVVTMLADVTGLESTFTPVAKAGESVTLNLDGHVISAESLSPVVSTSTDLIISENGNGEIITGGATALAVTGGTTTINGASLVGATNAASVTGGTLTINGGHFYGGVSSDIDNNGGSVAISSGWFRNEPSSDYLVEGTAAQQGSETHNYRTYNYTIDVETAVVNVNEVGYPSLGAAVAAANAYDDEAAAVTITLLDSISYNSPIDLTNANDKPIVLDLNGFKLSTETASFITTGGNLTITDNGLTKGKITSRESMVLDLTTASAAVTLNGCVIESTKEKGSAWNSDAAVNVDASGVSLNITNGAKVYTTNHLTTLRAFSGSVTIENSELSSGISSGIDSAGWYVVVGLGNASVTVNSGSFYTHTTINSKSSTFHIGNDNTTMTVNDGYFYSLGRTISSGSKNYYNKLTLKGGYYNKTPDVPSNGTGSYTTPTYGPGLSMQAIDPAETHPHATIGETLNYGYQVKETPIVYVADVNGTPFTSYADAITAALAYSDAQDTVRLTLLRDVSYNDTTNFVNASGKPIVLNLDNHTLSTSVTDFIKCTSGSLSVRGGTINSTAMRVVNKTGTDTINIENCIISSTATYTYSTGYYYDQGVIRIYNGSSTVNIKDSKIYTTGAMTAVADRNGTLNIDNSEISSGTESKGGIAVCAYSGTVTINSGCFYSSNDTTTRPAAYVAGSGASYTINGGYFYSASSRSIRAGTQSQISNFTIYGGYFNNSTSYTSSGKDYAPTIPAGYAQSPGASGTYPHSIKGTLSFSYVVGPTAQEASVPASTSTPVVTLGEARNGGVSF